MTYKDKIEELRIEFEKKSEEVILLQQQLNLSDDEFRNHPSYKEWQFACTNYISLLNYVSKSVPHLMNAQYPVK
ncbi:MAG: hypothetical protein H7339_17105 [Arcicella sp.]|nr:hypothetical protein [Arcicella sp.]